MLEREVKLAAPARFRMPALDGVAEGVAASPPETLQLRTVYWDTPDLRLARWGCTLRHRDGEGWNVKLPSASKGAVLARPELLFEGGPRHPPPAATELVRGFLRSEKLGVVARLRTVRRRTELRNGDGVRVAEVVDDEVSVIDGRRVAERFRELEVELADGAPEALIAACTERLELAGARVAEPTPKLIRALGPAAAGRPEIGAVPLGDEPDAGAVVRRALARSVTRFLRHDPGVVLGEDPEDVHQARVALRRMRSDLRTFRPLADPGWSDAIRDEARWFGELLGAVRDADVLGERLRAASESVAGEDRAQAATLIARLEDSRRAAREELLAARRGERFADLVDRLVLAAASPALTAAAAAPASEALPPLVAAAWRALRREHGQLGDDPPDESLHDLRIRVKRLRYAAEAAEPAIGKRAARLAEAAAELQDVLGEHQDATFAQSWLRAAADGSDWRRAFAAGQLSGRQSAAAARARRRWPKAWRELARPGGRTWLKQAAPAAPVPAPQV